MYDFPTQYDPSPYGTSNSGDPIKPIYTPKFNDNGIMELVCTGTEDVYDYIQSHRDSVDIHKIIQRFEEGDVTALSRVQGTFGDFTDYPKTYADLLNKVLAGEQSFNQLPLEVREQFGFSYERWLASAGSDPWLTAMGLNSPDVTTDPIDPAVPPDPTSPPS